MKQQELFVELIKSLEKNKKLFLAGKLHSEEEFINNIHKLQKLLPRILNDELRRFVEVFVNSIIKSKNYKIYIEGEKERTIKTQKQEAKRQEQLRKKRLEEERINEQKRKENEIREIVNFINIAINNNDFEKAIELFQNNYKNIAKYNVDLYSNILKRIEIIKQINSLKLAFNNYDLKKAIYLFENNFLDISIYDCKLYSKMCDKLDIMKCIEKRKIKKLIHFTSVSNLESILKKGLLSREMLEEKNIKFEYTDMQRYDGRKDCISLSIEYPNFKMLNFKKKQLGNDYAVIVLNAKSILLDDNKKYYLYVNAANSNATYWLEKEELAKSKYLDEMFKNKVVDKKCFYDRSERIPSYIPTNPQAEILYSGMIDCKNILEIHFATQDNYEKFINSCENADILNNVQFKIDNFYFKCNRKNIIWKER